jgi:hypothetical protein
MTEEITWPVGGKPIEVDEIFALKGKWFAVQSVAVRGKDQMLILVEIAKPVPVSVPVESVGDDW